MTQMVTETSGLEGLAFFYVIEAMLGRRSSKVTAPLRRNRRRSRDISQENKYTRRRLMVRVVVELAAELGVVELGGVVNTRGAHMPRLIQCRRIMRPSSERTALRPETYMVDQEHLNNYFCITW